MYKWQGSDKADVVVIVTRVEAAMRATPRWHKKVAVTTAVVQG